MRASILSVGSELLRGTLLDTNAQYFAREFTALGVQVVQVAQVADDLDAIASALRAACRNAEVVVISGGLGPTEDDLTREAVIDLTGEPPLVDEDILESIRARFASRGAEMPARNAKQAWRIPSATVIRNDQGTAPGWYVATGETTILALPGPPRENQPMWQEQVRPMLLPRLAGQAIISRTIKTIGIGESAVADLLGDQIAIDWPQVATYAKSDGVHVTITAAHNDRLVAQEAVRVAEQEVLSRLSRFVYGSGDDSLAAAITQPLATAGVQIVIWEIGSAGSLSAMLLADPSARRVIAEARLYPSASNRPGDSHSTGAGTLAEQTAKRAARGTDHGTVAVLAIEIADDDHHISNAKVGVALAHAGGFESRAQNVRGRPEEIRRRAALLAAEFLWNELRTAAGIRPAID